MSEIDYSPLGKAIERLREGLLEMAAEPGRTTLRDAVIKRFELTYELSCTMIARYLEVYSPSASPVDNMTFPTLIRTASEKGLLLSGWDVWQGFRKARNTTSHTYHEDKAAEVLGGMFRHSWRKRAICMTG